MTGLKINEKVVSVQGKKKTFKKASAIAQDHFKKLLAPCKQSRKK